MNEIKIIAITDVHGRLNQTLKIAEMSKHKDVDAIIVSGDLSRYKSIEEAKEVLEILRSSGRRIFYIPGNMDDPKICSEILIENVECVHEKKIEFKGYTIIGVGGALIGPFNTPFELSEEQFLEIFGKLLNENLKNNVILVTHNPPYNTNADKTSFNEHIGSKSIRLIIEKMEPILNVCGHVHEARSIDNINKTIIVNPGPLMHGYYSEIEIGKNVEAKLLKVH
ncbi:MAG: metallophosphoesterase family protein [Candidatus Methanomethylicia archaeon]